MFSSGSRRGVDQVKRVTPLEPHVVATDRAAGCDPCHESDRLLPEVDLVIFDVRAIKRGTEVGDGDGSHAVTKVVMQRSVLRLTPESDTQK